MTTLETTIDDIASTLHAAAKQKTDARAAKKVISMVRSLESTVVAEAILEIVRHDDRSREYLPLWNMQIKDRSRLRETIFMTACLLDLSQTSLQTELLSKHLDAMHKAAVHIEEVAPYKDFTAAPHEIRAKIARVIRTAVETGLALDASGLTLESVSLSWYGFLYISAPQAEVVREIILKSIAEGDAPSAVDVDRLRKKFGSPASRMKRAKSLFSTIRGAAETVEYRKGMSLHAYASQIQEKAEAASK